MKANSLTSARTNTRKNILATLATIGCAFSTAAYAQNVTSLDALGEITWQLPETRAEIDKALEKTGLTEDSVLCTGTELGKEFGPLSGTFVAPFNCDFGPAHKKLLMEVKTWIVVDLVKFDPVNSRAAVVDAISKTPAEKIFMYQVLLKAYWN
jgi:hypothetical protein